MTQTLDETNNSDTHQNLWPFGYYLLNFQIFFVCIANLLFTQCITCIRRCFWSEGCKIVNGKGIRCFNSKITNIFSTGLKNAKFLSKLLKLEISFSSCNFLESFMKSFFVKEIQYKWGSILKLNLNFSSYLWLKEWLLDINIEFIHENFGGSKIVELMFID